MGLPVACIQAGKLHRVPTVQHHPVPHIEPTVGHAVRVGRVVGVAEKHKVAGARGADRGAVVVKPLGPQAAHIPAALVQHIGQIAGTVKGRGRGAAAPDDERIIPKRLSPQNHGHYGGHNTTRICPKDAQRDWKGHI